MLFIALLASCEARIAGHSLLRSSCQRSIFFEHTSEVRLGILATRPMKSRGFFGKF